MADISKQNQDKRVAQVNIRVPPSEKQTFFDAAKVSGKDFSGWARDLMRKASTKKG